MMMMMIIKHCIAPPVVTFENATDLSSACFRPKTKMVLHNMELLTRDLYIIYVTLEHKSSRVYL